MNSVFEELIAIESSFPRIHAKVKPTTNPNDWLSSRAIDITFYNEKGARIGEASISSIDTDTPFLYNVEVFPQYRGMKYSHAMLDYLLREYQPTELTVRQDNMVAINLYKKYGFSIHQEFKENGNDMYDMQRKI